jgi:hypothetical protein
MIDHRLEHPWSSLMARGVYRVRATVGRTASEAISLYIVGRALNLMPTVEVAKKLTHGHCSTSNDIRDAGFDRGE